MINKALNTTSFQTLHLSKEHSTCPLITDIINFIKKSDLINNFTISHRFGKRVLINSKTTNFKKIDKENFVELVDYDPFKKILLLIGKEEPCIESPLHWYIHHARNDVNVVLLIKDKKYFENKIGKNPTIDNNYPLWTIEQIKEILGALKNSKIIVIKNTGVLFVGDSLKKIEDLFSNYRMKLK